MAKKQEVATKEEVGVPAVVSWDDDDSASAFDDMNKDDFAIPFLRVLQKGSPQVDADAAEYIDGAKPGMFFNTATQELFDAVDLIPVTYKRAMVVWKPNQGGFVSQQEVGYEAGLPRRKRDDGSESGIYIDADGNDVVDTRYHFCLHVRPDGVLAPVIVSLSSTQIKKSKSWNERMKNVSARGKNGQLIMYSTIWHCTTVPEDNDFGSWKGWKIDYVGPLQTKEQQKAAREAAEMFSQAGDVLAAAETKAGAEGSAEPDDEIPF